MKGNAFESRTQNRAPRGCQICEFSSFPPIKDECFGQHRGVVSLEIWALSLTKSQKPAPEVRDCSSLIKL